MNTIVIRIEEPPEGQLDYPIHLRHFDLATEKYTGKPISRTLPADIDAKADRIIKRLHDEGDWVAPLREIGNELYQILSECDVGKEWFKLSQARQNPATQVYLDIEPEKLSWLPWEFMAKPGNPGIFYEDWNRPMRGAPQNNKPAAILPPIRLLIVKCKMSTASASASPKDGTSEEQSESFAQEEIDSIIKAVGAHAGIWHTYVLREPTFLKLQQLLNDEFPPDVIHFIAHTPENEEAAFRLDDGDLLSMRRLEDLIRKMSARPKLLVFNGCRTTQIVNPTVFRDLGCRGIVTNHGLVYGDASVLFSENFYRELAESGSIDEAMWKARGKLQVGKRDDQYDWAMPTLTVYGAPQNVLSPGLEGLVRHQRAIVGTGIDGWVNWVVDRVGTREAIWRAIYGPDEKQKHVILVTGKKRYGKSQLLQSALLTCKLRGSLAVTVDLRHAPSIRDGKVSKEARDVLWLICYALMWEGRTPPGAPWRGISEESYSRLEALRDRLEYAPRHAGDDPPVNSRVTGSLDEEFGELLRILLRETEAIPDVREARSVIIAIDHIEGMSVEGLGLIKDRLLRPIARFSDSERVYLLIAEGRTENAIVSLHRDMWSNRVAYVTAKGFSPQYMRSLWREWGARKGWEKEQRQRWITQAVDYTAFRERVPPHVLVSHSDPFEEGYS